MIIFLRISVFEYPKQKWSLKLLRSVLSKLHLISAKWAYIQNQIKKQSKKKFSIVQYLPNLEDGSNKHKKALLLEILTIFNCLIEKSRFSCNSRNCSINCLNVSYVTQFKKQTTCTHRDKNVVNVLFFFFFSNATRVLCKWP
jgi:hypothetical protein